MRDSMIYGETTDFKELILRLNELIEKFRNSKVGV